MSFSEKSSKFIKIVGKQAGMSLIEILIALTLLAIGGSFIAGKAYETYQEGLNKSAKIQMQSLGQRLKEFRRHCGFYPSTEQGLDALINAPTGGRTCKNFAPGGYIEGGKIPEDPWGSEFEYSSDNGKKYTIISYGSDGEQGGEGADVDLNTNDF